jgi:S1-C subfamily serine protease
MQRIKTISITAVVVTIIFFTNQAVSQNIKLNPIKPGSKAASQLTDEQQAILAVRKIKASTVNVLGLPKIASSSGMSLTAGSQAVLGTGLILEADGLIVTNNHVVAGTNLDYTVILPDGSKYPAKIFGTDKFSDIAFLKIEAANLPAAELGDSDSLETGQTVMAIGNSLGRYQNSVSRGVVSGLGRMIDEPDGSAVRLNNLIQTDAAINLGNSGGPLINLAGQVVGINTLFDEGGTSLGFAVPINTVKDALFQQKTFGKISRPFLGISFVSITPLTQATDKLPEDNGAYVKSVAAGSPAGRAGVKGGDIIVEINGITLNANNEVDSEIQKYQAGTQIMLKIVRGKETLDLPVVLGELK